MLLYKISGTLWTEAKRLQSETQTQSEGFKNQLHETLRYPVEFQIMTMKQLSLLLNNLAMNLSQLLTFRKTNQASRRKISSSKVLNNDIPEMLKQIFARLPEVIKNFKTKI